jgi:hypothetical protein
MSASAPRAALVLEPEMQRDLNRFFEYYYRLRSAAVRTKRKENCTSPRLRPEGRVSGNYGICTLWPGIWHSPDSLGQKR